jgi:uncharacterized protein
MKIFLDTSSLFKLYHYEDGTDQLMDIFKNKSIEQVFLAEITKIEFDSVVWKKFRKREIDDAKVLIMIRNFETDSKKYTFIKDNVRLRKSARYFISKYGKDGLRTLDSIQLSSAANVSEIADLFISSDKVLNRIMESENLNTLKQED